MRMLMVTLAALGAMTLGAQAQNVVRSADSPQIYWVLTVSVKPGKLDDFKQLVAEAVAGAEKQPKTLSYQYNLSPDQKTVDIVERYADSAGVIAHVEDFGAKYAKRFMEDVTPTHFAVFGPVSAAAKKAIAGFNPVYMSPIDGFVRE
jgi:quinol monooxygenase YgiN